MSVGSASPAETQTRTEENSWLALGFGLAPVFLSCFALYSSIWPYRVGTPKNTVGRNCSRCLKTFSGVGASGLSTAEAPTDMGKYMPLPSPYAKKSLAAEKQISSSVSPSTFLPNASEVTTMSYWEGMAPFGEQVD